MDRDRTLAAVSAAQLASGVAGMVVALRRVHPYDVFWMHGRPEAIARDTLFKGTALSAPVSTLVTQTALTVAMARRPSRRVAQGLAIDGPVRTAVRARSMVRIGAAVRFRRGAPHQTPSPGRIWRHLTCFGRRRRC